MKMSPKLVCTDKQMQGSESKRLNGAGCKVQSAGAPDIWILFLPAKVAGHSRHMVKLLASPDFLRIFYHGDVHDSVLFLIELGLNTFTDCITGLHVYRETGQGQGVNANINS